MPKDFIIKAHKSRRLIVAICDKELHNKKFEEGIKQLDLTTTFFKGEEISQDELIEMMQDFILEDASFNIVGENSIRIAKSLNLVNNQSIGKVQGIPFALVLL